MQRQDPKLVWLASKKYMKKSEVKTKPNSQDQRLSTEIIVFYGVPQDSTITYINNHQYANDNNFGDAMDADTNVEVTKTALKRIRFWSKFNSLDFNASKCAVICLQKFLELVINARQFHNVA